MVMASSDFEEETERISKTLFSQNNLVIVQPKTKPQLFY